MVSMIIADILGSDEIYFSSGKKGKRFFIGSKDN
jgi:hypothetical protein